MTSVTVCNTSSTSSTSIPLTTQQVVVTGATDPIYLSVNYSCQACPTCNISADVVGASDTVIEETAFSCNVSEVPQIYTFPAPNEPIRIRFKVQFPDGDQQRCVTLDRVRLYYYMGCSATIMELTRLPETQPGTLNNSTMCVDNAEPVGPLLAFCSEMGEWLPEYQGVRVLCNCPDGYEPNSNNTACEGEGGER